MKKHVEALITSSLEQLQNTGKLPQGIEANIKVERTKDRKFGDFSCNVAMILAKAAQCSPRELAQSILDHLPPSSQLVKAEIAGPGFLNFFLEAEAYHDVIGDILKAKEKYGQCNLGQGKKVLVEFVSANPTGPLHVGHGRGAAYGATLGNFLSEVGYRVHREYYVNDAGRQMDILATSVWLRYLELLGEKVIFPRNGYQGDYVKDIAQQIQKNKGNALRHSADAIFTPDIPTDLQEDGSGDKEAHVDALIQKAKTLLGASDYAYIHLQGLNDILNDIRQDLGEFGVEFDEWFSERTLTQSNHLDKAIQQLKAAGHTFEEKGALWFRATEFGDEKDRVLVRENGQHTYFASDVAYHLNKFDRGFDFAIDIFGADHHGYVPRIHAFMKALGMDPNRLQVHLVQFAILYRGKERLSMSTRSGSFVTLRELRKEVGNDAARFFYVMRKCEQHMDFDLELATSKTNDNPVYYIQYAHARICSVFRQLAEKQLTWDEQQGLQNLTTLTQPQEDLLLESVSRYSEIVQASAINYEPHIMVHFLRDLANHLHTYYNACQFIVDDAPLRDARLCLISAVRQALANGLRLLGVSAVESM